MKVNSLNFNYASPSELMHKVSKDKEAVEHIQSKLSLLLTNSVVTRALYYWSCHVNGFKTLGEEYTYLTHNHPEQKLFIWKKTRLLLFLLRTFGPFLLATVLKVNVRKTAFRNKLLRAILTTSNLETDDVISVLTDLHNALFFIDSRYYEFINRLLRIQYVSVFPSPEKDFNYKFVGYIIFFGLAVKLVSFCVALKRNYCIREEPEVSGPKETVESVDCKICFEERKESSATLCGHVFCWKCILKFSQMKGECPVCRAKVHPKDIVRVFNSK